MSEAQRREGESRGSRLVFRAVGAAWALLALAIALLLAAVGGHPPGLVFVPLVAVGWLVGHLLILAAARSSRSLATFPPQATPARDRPVAFWVATAFVTCAFVGATGVLLLMGGHVLVQRSLDLLGGLALVAALALWALHAAVLAGLASGRRSGEPLLRFALTAWGLGFAWMLIVGAWDRRAGVAAIGVVGAVATAVLVRALRARDRPGPRA